MNERVLPPTPRLIDMDTYPRRAFFDYFKSFDLPVHSCTVQIDITHALDHVKKHNLVFSLAMTLLVTKAANQVPEFRQRFADDWIAEYDYVRPFYTILSPSKIVAFILGQHEENFGKCYEANMAIRREVLAGRKPESGMTNPGHIIVSVVPWHSFTALTMPFSRNHASVPIFSIGKFYQQGPATLIPLAIQSNHALIDGYHIGQFLDCLNSYLADPERHMTPAV